VAHKPCNVDTALMHFGSKQENPNLLRNLALKKIHCVSEKKLATIILR